MGERPHRSARGELRGEEGRDQHGLEHSREHCNVRDEKERQVRHSGRCDDQDPPEEGDQGWEARGLRQNRHGEGEAGQDRRQGVPREGPQGRVLRASWSGVEPCEEAPRVLLHFPPLAPLPPPALLAAFTHPSFCPGWLEGAWSSMAFRPQAALRGRSHVFPPCLAERKKKKK